MNNEDEQRYAQRQWSMIIICLKGSIETRLLEFWIRDRLVKLSGKAMDLKNLISFNKYLYLYLDNRRQVK